jgi:hypothetical protein
MVAHANGRQRELRPDSNANHLRHVFEAIEITDPAGMEAASARRR